MHSSQPARFAPFGLPMKQLRYSSGTRQTSRCSPGTIHRFVSELALLLLLASSTLALAPATKAREHTETSQLYAFASVVSAAPGERFSYTFMLTNPSGRQVDVTGVVPDELMIDQIVASHGTRCSSASTINCSIDPNTHGANIGVVAHLTKTARVGDKIDLRVSARLAARTLWSNTASVRVSVPTSGDSVGEQHSLQSPLPTPTVAPDTPCLRAALAAATRQGAIYSQGGALADDPINPATGQPYPRTGPNSFDCSGLVWWAYQQAGVNIGTSTYAQVNDGTAISCTLADLNGPATTCWAPSDLIFLQYAGSGSGPGSGSSQHVAIYVSNGLFMDCYNHATNCILHDVSRDSFYQRHFWQARRILSGCEGLAIDPGIPIGDPIGPPTGDGVCVADPLEFGDQTGVVYTRGCGPPVLPPGQDRPNGTRLRQFTDAVGWLGQTGRLAPAGAAGVHLHLGLDIGAPTDMCRWPLQVAGVLAGEPPPGAWDCWTTWADPIQFLPQANPDTLALSNGTPVPVITGRGDPTLSEALVQLPPPGHPAANILPQQNPEQPDGTWWSPGNDDRAGQVNGALGGPAIDDWLSWLWCSLFGWLPWAGC